MGLMSAIGAFANTGSDILGRQIKNEEDEAIQVRRDDRVNDLAQKRAVAMEKLKAEMAETQRQESVGRIDAKASEIADESLGAKRGLIDAGITDLSAWTADQQAAVDQSLAIDKKSLMDDSRVREKAAISTGDISAKDAATIERDNRRIDATANSDATRERIADKRIRSQEYIAELRDGTAQTRIEAFIRRTGASGDNGTKELLSVIDGARKDLASDAQNLRSLYATEIKDVLISSVRAKIEADYKPKFEEIERKRRALEEDYNFVREKIGLPTRSVSAAAPSSSSGRSPYTGQGSLEDATAGQLEVMAYELNRPDLSERDKAAIRQEMERLKAVKARPAAPNSSAPSRASQFKVLR